MALILIIGCHKEKIPQTGLIGNWQIAKIDSVKTSAFDERVIFLDDFPEIGEISFKEDSTGYFKNSIRDITCGETEFVWSYNYDLNDVTPFNGRNYIKLIFENGISYTSHYYQISNDSIDFFLMAYCNENIGGIGRPLYYRSELIRK